MAKSTVKFLDVEIDISAVKSSDQIFVRLIMYNIDIHQRYVGDGESAYNYMKDSYGMSLSKYYDIESQILDSIKKFKSEYD